MSVNTITLLSFSGKSKMMANLGSFLTKAKLGGGACTFFKQIFIDKWFSNGKYVGFKI